MTLTNCADHLSLLASPLVSIKCHPRADECKVLLHSQHRCSDL